MVISLRARLYNILYNSCMLQKKQKTKQNVLFQHVLRETENREESVLRYIWYYARIIRNLMLRFTLYNAHPLYKHQAMRACTPKTHRCIQICMRAIVLLLGWYSARERAHFNILSYASVYPYVWHIQNLCLNHRKSTRNRAITHTHLCSHTHTFLCSTFQTFSHPLNMRN